MAISSKNCSLIPCAFIFSVSFNLILAAKGGVPGKPGGGGGGDGTTYACSDGKDNEIDCGIVDCNDENALVNPGINEDCSDEIDNDCDELIDCGDEEWTTTQYKH